MYRLTLVSAIIIFLNGERFLHEAIDSVFAQTFDDWELLLVDDGSSDGSTEIARRYAQAHPDRVRYLEHAAHRNLGMSASRNLGIRHANGAYIAFLDADDVWAPSTLEEQVAILQVQRQAAMVYGPIEWWYSWTGAAEDKGRDFVEELGIRPNTLVAPPALLSSFLQNKATVPSGMLVRRETFDRVGGFEDRFTSLYEDQVFCAKVCLNAPVFVAGTSWYRYRQHPESTCAVEKQAGRYYGQRVPFLEWLAAYLATQSAKQPEIQQIVQKQLWPYHHPIQYKARRIIQSLVSFMQTQLLVIARRILPLSLRYWLGKQWDKRKNGPAVGQVRFGSLRRLTPISRRWGFDRGDAIDRYYIQRFLAEHATDIQGRVLEVADDTYTRQFGGDRVTRSDVVHREAGDPKATIIADLAAAEHIPSDSFDCIILTQTLQLIYDLRAALKTLVRILKPGGVLLITVPGISQITRYDMDRWGDCWRFTTWSAQQLLEEFVPPERITVEGYGNVFVATAFLYGLALQEVKRAELDYYDPDYQLIIAIRAVKPQVAE